MRTTPSVIAIAVAACLSGMPAQASAQRYFMRAKTMPAQAASAPAAPPTYAGTWFNTGEQAAGVCSGGTRRVDWVYACRVAGNVSYGESECDPARKPDTLSHVQSCSSVCDPIDKPGYVGGGNSQTVSGTLDQMKAVAKSFCEGQNARPDLDRACSVVLDSSDPTRGRVILSADFGPLQITPSANAWHGDCRPAN